MLVLKEHAVLTLGNLIFDSKLLFTVATSHRTTDGKASVVKPIVDLIHFKRSQLTYACLWTLNNLMNFHYSTTQVRKEESVVDDLLASGIGVALKVVHSCYRYARDKARAEKDTLFKYVAPASEEGANDTVGQKQVIQELYWFYHYFTGCGPLYSGALLKQYTDMLQFSVEDLVKLVSAS